MKQRVPASPPPPPLSQARNAPRSARGAAAGAGRCRGSAVGRERRAESGEQIAFFCTLASIGPQTSEDLLAWGCFGVACWCWALWECLLGFRVRTEYIVAV